MQNAKARTERLRSMKDELDSSIASAGPEARHIFAEAEHCIASLEALAVEMALNASGQQIRQILARVPVDPYLVTLADVLDAIYDECARYDQKVAADVELERAKLARVLREIMIFSRLPRHFVGKYLKLPGLDPDEVGTICAAFGDYGDSLVRQVGQSAQLYRETMYHASDHLPDVIEPRPLMEAGKFAFVMDLLGLGALDANAGFIDGNRRHSLLSYVAARGRADLIAYLVACGADANISVGDAEDTPLVQAVLRADRPVIEALLAAGARVALADDDIDRLLETVPETSWNEQGPDARSTVRELLLEASGRARALSG